LEAFQSLLGSFNRASSRRFLPLRDAKMKLDQYCSVPQQTGLEGTDACEPLVPDPPHDQLGRQMLRPLAKFDALAALVPCHCGQKSAAKAERSNIGIS
jgi:hypothetical protein